MEPLSTSSSNKSPEIGIPVEMFDEYQAALGLRHKAEKALSRAQNTLNTKTQALQEATENRQTATVDLVNSPEFEQLPSYQQGAFCEALIASRLGRTRNARNYFEDRVGELRPLAEAIDAKREQEPDGILTIAFDHSDQSNGREPVVSAHKVLDLSALKSDVTAEENDDEYWHGSDISDIYYLRTERDERVFGGFNKDNSDLRYASLPYPYEPYGLPKDVCQERVSVKRQFIFEPDQLTPDVVNQICVNYGGNRSIVLVGSDAVAAFVHVIETNPVGTYSGNLFRKLVTGKLNPGRTADQTLVDAIPAMLTTDLEAHEAGWQEYDEKYRLQDMAKRLGQLVQGFMTDGRNMPGRDFEDSNNLGILVRYCLEGDKEVRTDAILKNMADSIKDDGRDENAIARHVDVARRILEHQLILAQPKQPGGKA